MFYKLLILLISISVGREGLASAIPEWEGLQKTNNASASRFPFLFSLVFESKLSTPVKTKKPLAGRCLSFAEREGFEPSIQV